MNPLELLAVNLVMKTLSPEGGYGGITMCIKCKQKRLDKYVNGDGLEQSACDHCPNNIMAMKWEEG